ncbi:MAG: hypothetical protein WBG90_17790 [Saonia sp.]
MLGKNFKSFYNKFKNYSNIGINNKSNDESFPENGFNVRDYSKLYYSKILIKNEIANYKFVDSTVGTSKKAEPFIVTILILIPLSYYSYLLIPEGQEVLDFGWFNIGNYGFNDVRIFLWYVYIKLFVLIPLCIWFITSTNWWRYSLFSPIIIYTYQLWEAVQDEIELVDETAYLDALPIILLLLFFLLILSHFIRYQSKILDLYNGIGNEIENLFEQFGKTSENINRRRKEFNIITRKVVDEKSAKEHLDALQRLKKELMLEIINNKE